VAENEAVMPVGIYAGLPLAEVPAGYLLRVGAHHHGALTDAEAQNILAHARARDVQAGRSEDADPEPKDG
jgi:hypothetical protein